MASFQSICIIIIYLIYLLNESYGLYEDQIGKFDWKLSYVGKVKFASFDKKRVIVATEENVLAALSVQTGSIIWRHILEESKEAQIKLLVVGTDILTISGSGNTWFARNWESSTGVLLSEWVMNFDGLINCDFAIIQDSLVHIVPVPSSHLEVSFYGLKNGLKMGLTKISTPWLTNKSKCVIVNNLYSCITNTQLNYVNVVSEKIASQELKALLGVGGENIQIKIFDNENPSVLITDEPNAHILKLNEDQATVLHSNLMPNAFQLNSQIIQIEGSGKASHILITQSDLNTNKRVSQTELEYQGFGKPTIAAGQCLGQNCDLLVSCADDALLLIKYPEGKILWNREEALSNIVATEFLELPVSELDASIENEFKTSDVLSMFLHRIGTQIKQFSSFIFGSQLIESNSLVRDDFGLHKIIVVATKSGKLFGIDTLTGSLAWSHRLPNIKPFSTINNDKMLLFVQRTARYAPLSAQCVLLAEDSITGKSIMFQFDPITGYSKNSIERLNYHIKQAMLLPSENEEHIKPILIFTEKNEVYLYPENSKQTFAEQSFSTHMYVVDSKVNTLKGYKLSLADDVVKANNIWNINLGPSKLVALSAKPSNERVHSQGRVLPDRSVYYKYINPNLIALATLTDDPIHKHVLSVYLVDGVSGLILYSTSHKRAKGPIHLLHSENWLVYSYFSERFRRTEVISVELYEGLVQSNTTAFSSYAVSQLPEVQSSAYILPAFPIMMAVTLTERGITNKFILIALSNGGVVEVPWLLLQPRFANVPCGPEESCIPYMPEMPLPNEAFINYNQTISKVKGIEVAPARLESTSHVLVYGLDLFYTKVAPSKTFDLLKEDFEHHIIILVLLGLISATYLSKYFASQKALKQAWK